MKPTKYKRDVHANDNLYALLVCPQCNFIGFVDREQYEGRISIQCDCGYHETHDLRIGEEVARGAYGEHKLFEDIDRKNEELKQ